MLKKIFLAIPHLFVITLAILFLLQFLILEFCRLIFYFTFKTAEGKETMTIIVLKAFWIGKEFDVISSTYTCSFFLPYYLC